ncbi:MAG: WG repeat-containing protein [Prevotellaceae bacterium]|jgi:hypothetical protein|nr:WG repeat-containing protein [Prevotellaceae bacterium]
MRIIIIVLISLLLCAGVRAQELIRFTDTKAMKQGFRDTEGKVIIPAKYDDAGGYFSEGLAWVKSDGKYGYVDKTGKEVIPLKYNDAGNFSEGLAWVKSDYKYGYVDKTGKVIIPRKYDGASDFHEGLAGVYLNGKMGYIDKTGKVVIPIKKYNYGGNFSEGLAQVSLNNEKFYIDTTGTTVPYTGVEMKIIWENLLESCIKQLNDCRSSLNKSSGDSSPFVAVRPYLVVRTKAGKCEDTYFVEYLGGKFNKNAIGNLKTLIIAYDYLHHSALYIGGVRGESWGKYIIYFDIEKRECTGYDIILGPSLPNELIMSHGSVRIMTISDSETVKKVESRLAGSEQQ